MINIAVVLLAKVNLGVLLQAAALCRSGSDKVRSSQDSVKSFIKIIYPEDILISDARL